MKKRESAEALLKEVYVEFNSYLIGVGNNWIVNQYPPTKSEYKDFMKAMFKIARKIERRIK